jgi:CubicO group peptidase (beta-lactamase class C family)
MVWLRRAGLILAAIVGLAATWALAAAVVYSPEYVGRVITSGESEYGDYLHTFPLSPLAASQNPFRFEEAPEEDRVSAIFESVLGVDDLDSFLAEAETQAFIVIHDDRILFEDYYKDFDRDSMLTSFSVAKSFTSALIGIAIAEGFIGSVDDPITAYLPELGTRDDRFEQISIRDVLLMASGLEYRELRWFLFNGDDPLTTYYPDQRTISLENTNIVDPPGRYFNYNKYHPQLLGMILERTTGMSVTEYTQTRLWDQLGMEFDGAWALDSVESDFEKMEAGLNARAIDYAKFGRLFLRGGEWEGVQVVPAAWVKESTSLDPSTHNSDYYSHSFGPFVYGVGTGYYKYMWYGKLRHNQPADVIAEGDKGQIIYVSPAHRVIIVRNGTDYGIDMEQWTNAFYEASELLGAAGG